MPRINEPRGRLTLLERRCLLQLMFRLCDLCHRWLTGRTDEHLAADAQAGDKYRSFTETHLHHMAAELAVPIMASRKLRLGSIWPTLKPDSQYRAIFVWSNKDEDRLQTPVTWAFTSASQAAVGSQALDTNDIDSHVSLAVDVECLCVGDAPQLRKWLLGMCFFDGCPRVEIVFPWPRAMQNIGL